MINIMLNIMLVMQFIFFIVLIYKMIQYNKQMKEESESTFIGHNKENLKRFVDKLEKNNQEWRRY